MIGDRLSRSNIEQEMESALELCEPGATAGFAESLVNLRIDPFAVGGCRYPTRGVCSVKISGICQS